MMLQCNICSKNLHETDVKLFPPLNNGDIRASLHVSGISLFIYLFIYLFVYLFIYLFNNLFKGDKFTKIQYTCINKSSQTNWLVKVNYPILQKRI